MVPLQISGRVIADRLNWAIRMVQTIRELPLVDQEAFFADNRNIWTADSCLRRALEALFDLGVFPIIPRHHFNKNTQMFCP